MDTSSVADRRLLHFTSVEEAIAEAERLAAAERSGTLTQLGNWTLGQALGHVAAWAEYSYTGAPMKVPLPIRLILRLGKKKFLTQPMRAGVKIPRTPGGTLATDPLPLEETFPRFVAAMQRLKREAPQMPNIIFGPLTHDEWINLNLRHSELHLGFFRPVTGA